MLTLGHKSSQRQKLWHATRKSNQRNLCVCGGLTFHSAQKQVFPGNRLHWYWQPKNKETKHDIHLNTKQKPEKNVLANKTKFTPVWYAIYDLWLGNGAGPCHTTQELTQDSEKPAEQENSPDTNNNNEEQKQEDVATTVDDNYQFVIIIIIAITE